MVTMEASKMIDTLLHEYAEIDKKLRDEIEKFVADGSKVIDRSFHDGTAYTLWIKEGKYCIIRAFWMDTFEKKPGVSVDLAYVSGDKIIEGMFKNEPDVFRETLGGRK